MFLVTLGVISATVYVGIKIAENLAKPNNPLLSREQQTVLISATDVRLVISDKEKLVNHNLTVSSVALGLAILGTFIYPPLGLISMLPALYVTKPILEDAYKAIFHDHQVRVSILDSILITICVGTGSFVALALGVTLYYTSRKILIKTEDNSRQRLINLFGEQSQFVWLITDGVEVQIPFEQLQVGDTIVINAGEMVPIDGTIVAGTASIDQHKLTGEAQPAEKIEGDPVFMSTMVLAGQIKVEVETMGSETIAAKIGTMLNQTADFKSLVQSRGEALADKSTLPMLGLGAIALPLLGPIGAGSVLTCTFAYHLRILAPIGMLNFLNLASQQGILIKDGRSLELLNQVDTIVFDKTGTLTLEQPHVGNVYTCHGYTVNEILTYAANAEVKQTHPIAKAILEEATKWRLPVAPASEADYEIGYGIKMKSLDGVVRVGSARYMDMEGITIPLKIKTIQKDCYQQGYSLVFVAIGNQLGGAIELQATIRPEAKAVINRLKKRGLSLYIISGDHEAPTKKLATELDIDHYFAEILPKDKANIVERLQEAGHSVCFVGDGINDSIALKKANTSISLRGATTIATDTAQIILMDQTLNQLDQIIEIARAFDQNMNISFIATMLQSIIGIYGALFLNFGLITPIILNNVGLAIGASNSMLPVLQHKLLINGKNKPVVC